MTPRKREMIDALIQMYNDLRFNYEYFESDSHQYYTARKKVMRLYPDLKGIIEEIGYDEFEKEYKSYLDSLHKDTIEDIIDDTYEPVDIPVPDMSMFGVDVDNVEFSDDLEPVDMDRINHIGLLPYIRWYALIHCMDYRDVEIGKHLFQYVTIRRLTKAEVFTEVRHVTTKYMAYLGYQDGDDIFKNYRPSVEETEAVAQDSFGEIFGAIQHVYRHHNSRFTSGEARFQYAKDKTKDKFRIEVYRGESSIPKRRREMIKYLVTENLTFEKFWEFHKSTHDMDTLRSMVKMNYKKKPWWLR